MNHFHDNNQMLNKFESHFLILFCALFLISCSSLGNLSLSPTFGPVQEESFQTVFSESIGEDQ